MTTSDPDSPVPVAHTTDPMPGYRSSALTSLADLVALWSSMEFQVRWFRQEAGELDPTSWKLIYRIAVHGPTRPSELAEMLGVTRSTISKVMAALETAGLVVRTPDRHDRRGVRVSLTAEGVREAQKLFDGADAMMVQLLEGWSDERRQHFAEALEEFVDKARRFPRQEPQPPPS
ncbi:MarR family winged helix-turn-helix transcriptional regulator [Modestobacter sp. SSW1-42]|uniref:MarR family winged helix-turn-helix transcriptional regulator n=1 Tax=Modestobacter sp. SSW1-42 TaxID=596372 RepID=UPI003987CE28